MLIVGLLLHQTMRTLWILRHSQVARSNIHQARELLDLARQLDRQLDPATLQSLQSKPLIVPHGDSFGTLQIQTMDENSESVPDSFQTQWIAKIPTDALGQPLPNTPPVVVRLERETR